MIPDLMMGVWRFACVYLPTRIRELPQSEGASSSGELDSLNLIVVVVFAIGISFLARFLATRGRRK